MSTKTKMEVGLKNLLIIFILIGAATAVSGYEDVTLDIEFDDSSIKPGEDAILFVEIENEEDDDISVDVEIWDDDEDERLEKDGVSIDEDETKTVNYTLNDFSDWDPYDCRSHKIRVEVEREEKTETLKISGDDFKISISPSEPSADDEITITIEDEDNHEVEEEYIIITNLDTDDYIKEKTDDDGIVEFTPEDERKFEDSPAGEYEIMVDNEDDKIEEEYCSTRKTFIVEYKIDKGGIKVVDPKLPDVPQVNDQVTIKITTAGGKAVASADVTVSGPNFNEVLTTNSDGYIYFIPKSSGNYDVEITDEKYASVTKTIAVAAQSQLSISFSPDPPEIGKELTIIIKADGKAVSGAEVTLTDPEDDKKSDTTDSSGRAEFDVLTLTGEYTVTAKKSGYADASKEQKVENPFKITVPKSANVGDIVKVEVLDKNNDPVSDATVKVDGSNLKTNSNGEVEFTIDELKDYKISIEKDGFTKVERTLSVEGELTIKLTPEKPQKDKDLTITVLADDIEVTSDITITKPDGTTDEVEEGIYTFKTEQVGRYTITASKSGYSDVSLDFDVIHSLMKLEYDTVDGNLVFKITTSDGKPVSGAEVGIYATTNEEGIAVLEFDNNYSVSVMKENYEATKGTIQVPETISFLEIFVVILILILILVILILLLRERKESTKKKTGLKR